MFIGIVFITLAQLMWGLLPFYYTTIDKFSYVTVGGYRMILCFVGLFLWVLIAKNYIELVAFFKNPRTIFWLLISALLLAGNWLLYIFAVSIHRVLEGSLGYFMTPLFNAAIGVLFFKDIQSRLQKIAIIISFIGVVYLIFFYGHFPWLGLSLTATFGLYSAVRKKIVIDPFLALTVETLLMVPVGILLIYFSLDVVPTGAGIVDWFWLLLFGPFSAMALVLYLMGLGRVDFSLSGMLFVIGPSLQFLSAIALGEELNIYRFFGFLIIWIALFTYLSGTYIASKKAEIKKI